MDFDAIESALIGTGKRPGIAVNSAEDVFAIARNWTRYYQGLEGF